MRKTEVYSGVIEEIDRRRAHIEVWSDERRMDVTVDRMFIYLEKPRRGDIVAIFILEDYAGRVHVTVEEAPPLKLTKKAKKQLRKIQQQIDEEIKKLKRGKRIKKGKIKPRPCAR